MLEKLDFHKYDLRDVMQGRSTGVTPSAFPGRMWLEQKSGGPVFLVRLRLDYL